MVEYIGTSPSQPIALYPRAVYRVVVERDGLTALSFATGLLRWRQVVEGMIDRSASPAGFPLGGGLDNVTNEDRTAVVDYRAGSHPGTLTVADLVRAIEDATPYSAVVSITRRDPVPAGGVDELAAERDVVKAGAEVDADAGTVFAKLKGFAGGFRTVFVAGAVVAVVVLVFVYLPKPRS